MSKKKTSYYDDTMLRKTVNTTIGIVGLNVAAGASAGLTGTTGTIVRSGVLPMSALGLLKEAAPDTRRRK